MSLAGDVVPAAITGFVAGGLASIVAPWAQWSIEKRRETRERRRRLIEDGRALVAEYRPDGKGRGFLGDPRYLALRPFVSEKASKFFHEEAIAVWNDSYGTRGNIYAATLASEIDRIERDWKLD